MMAELYQSHRDRLCRLVSRRFSVGIEAEDAVQEAFARACALDGTVAIASPVALVTRILLNLASDGRRRKMHHDQYLDYEHDGSGEPAPDVDPEAHASARQRWRLLLAAIEDLPPRCRQVFIMHRFQGLPHAEIAAQLGISRSMVEKHVIRALTELRDMHGGGD